MQSSPSSQAVPSLAGVLLQLWVALDSLVQASRVQGLPSSQALPLPGTQVPALQASPTVHDELSEQTLPSVTGLPG